MHTNYDPVIKLWTQYTTLQPYHRHVLSSCVLHSRCRLHSRPRHRATEKRKTGSSSPYRRRTPLTRHSTLSSVRSRRVAACRPVWLSCFRRGSTQQTAHCWFNVPSVPFFPVSSPFLPRLLRMDEPELWFYTNSVTSASFALCNSRAPSLSLWLSHLGSC